MSTPEAVAVGVALIGTALLGGWLWRKLTRGSRSDDGPALAADAAIQRLIEVNLKRGLARGQTHEYAMALVELGRLAEKRGDLKEAIRHYGQAKAILSLSGSGDLSIPKRSLERVRAELGSAEFDRIIAEIGRDLKEQGSHE